MTSKEVFFGIMVGDLFGDVDPQAEGYDEQASVEKYGQMCSDAIIVDFAKHNETVSTEWESQNVGGVTPFGLKTKIDGDTDHEDVGFVDDILGEVWQSWDWVVEIDPYKAKWPTVNDEGIRMLKTLDEINEAVENAE